MDSIDEFFKKQERDDQERRFYLAMEGARNAMRAVLICVQEGEYDEAERLIKEALGEAA